MADAIVEQVLAAFATAVETSVEAAIAGSVVERNRSRPVAESHDNFVVLLDGPSRILSDNTCSTHYEIDVDVVGHARAASDAALGQAVNNLYGEVAKAALADHTLGGLTIDVQESDVIERYVDDEADKPTGSFQMQFNLQFSTAYGDPFTLGS